MVINLIWINSHASNGDNVAYLAISWYNIIIQHNSDIFWNHAISRALTISEYMQGKRLFEIVLRIKTENLTSETMWCSCLYCFQMPPALWSKYTYGINCIPAWKPGFQTRVKYFVAVGSHDVSLLVTAQTVMLCSSLINLCGHLTGLMSHISSYLVVQVSIRSGYLWATSLHLIVLLLNLICTYST